MMLRPCLLVVAALLVQGCSSDDAAARRRTVPESQAQEPSAGAAQPDAGNANLDPASVRLYFGSGPGLRARKAWALERWAEAEKGFVAAAATASDDKSRARAVMMAGLAQSLQQKWRPAANNLRAALPQLPLLADYINYQIARALYFARDREQAMAHARKVSTDSIVGASTELLIGDLLRAKGSPQQVAEHYQSYLDRRKNGIRQAEAHYRLAGALVELVRASRRDGKDIGRALALYREITIRWPLSAWAERADEQINKLLKNPPSTTPRATLRAGRAPLSADELIERGFVYYKAMRNPKSEADFEAALKASGIDAEKSCVAAYHRANSVFKQRKRKRAAPLFDLAMKACAKTTNADLQVKSAYQAGRSYANFRERKKAIDRYSRVEKQHPEHSYADDARLRQAEEYRDLNDQKKVTKLLASIPKAYPEGDMRAEAMWRLAWRAFKKKDYRQAIKWLSKQKQTKPIDDNYWAEGQAQYWMGRAYAELGNKGKSVAAYREAISVYPMSYYALLALNRLRESHPKVFAEVVAEIEPAPPSRTRPMSFKPRAVYKSDGFKRALEFLRLGLGDRAEAELRRMNFRSPPGKSRLEDADQIDRVWAMAYLFHQAQRYGHSHWVTRWHVLDYKRHWPSGDWRAHWDIAYPKAWWPLLTKWAKKRGYPPELQIAFVREESAFDPLRESYANAVGLTQMIFPTARRFAKGTGIKVSRSALRDPEKNVTIGSNFLKFLWQRYSGRVALIVPAYNAGEGAVGKWLRLRGSWPQDEWNEEIPYDQARRYSKRVISSYFAYSFLKDGTIPVMPNTAWDKAKK
ncbi:MAG: transglycosylase SLT domain-containing protein [Deltaproteobacteria bacterium]|nr:transglycosylase SLT domain-containing protein [Deltaproteobacteria bacterium]